MWMIPNLILPGWRDGWTQDCPFITGAAYKGWRQGCGPVSQYCGTQQINILVVTLNWIFCRTKRRLMMAQTSNFKQVQLSNVKVYNSGCQRRYILLSPIQLWCKRNVDKSVQNVLIGEMPHLHFSAVYIFMFLLWLCCKHILSDARRQCRNLKYSVPSQVHKLKFRLTLFPRSWGSRNLNGKNNNCPCVSCLRVWASEFSWTKSKLVWD